MILKDTATFQVLFIVSLYSGLGTSLLRRSTLAFTYLKVKSAKNLFTSIGFGLGLVILVLVLVLRIWSCLHHWNDRLQLAEMCKPEEPRIDADLLRIRQFTIYK